MAVTGALQQGALKYARANGIGIVRLLPNDQVEHLIYMMTSATMKESLRLNSSEFYRALTVPGFVGKNRDFYAEGQGHIFGSWRPLLKEMLSA